MTIRRKRPLGLESLEARTVLSADLVGGVLTVVGTKKSDVIQVDIPVAGQLAVDVNGVQSLFDLSTVNELRIFGLKGDDQITVDDAVLIDTWISGAQGKDHIIGGGGNDEIHGDNGNDEIHGGAGNDAIFGDNGNDALYGDDGDDVIHGDNGKDAAQGGIGEDTIHGDNGNDELDGGEGNDNLYGDNGNDSLDGEDDDDYLDGGNGKDDCHGGADDDEIKGGKGKDNLDGDDGDNLLDPDSGNDTLVNGVEVDLDNEFKAILIGIGGQHGKASFETENEDGQIKTELEIEVRHLAANATLDVVIDGVLVGQIVTDASGEGEIEFSTDPSDDELPFPLGFPVIQAGTTISVGGVLLGTFAPEHDDD